MRAEEGRPASLGGKSLCYSFLLTRLRRRCGVDHKSSVPGYQQLAAPNLCPAPNGKDRCLPSNQSIDLLVKPSRRYSLAQEVQRGSYVAPANCWAFWFHKLPCQQPDPGPKLLRKIRHAAHSGSLVPCPYIWPLPQISRQHYNLAWRRDVKLLLFFRPLTIEVERQRSPHTARGSTPMTGMGEESRFRFVPIGTGRMEVSFNSFRRRCRGLLF